MHADAEFTVTSFEPADYSSPIELGSAVGHAHLTKTFTGDLVGESATQFSAIFDQAANTGSYVATEAFTGSLGGREGTFGFVHAATTIAGGPAVHPYFVIAPGSGTGELTGITGTGSLVIDADGTHRVTLDYSLPPD